jgi:hypothetical protein
LLPLSSCVYFPDGREVWQPVPLFGVITDCASNLPIVGALVSSSKHTNKVLTDDKGIFLIQGKRTNMYVSGIGDSYESGILTISAKGFIRLKMDIRYGSPSHKEKELEVMCLSHITD